MLSLSKCIVSGECRTVLRFCVGFASAAFGSQRQGSAVASAEKRTSPVFSSKASNHPDNKQVASGVPSKYLLDHSIYLPGECESLLYTGTPLSGSLARISPPGDNATFVSAGRSTVQEESRTIIATSLRYRDYTP